MRHWVTMLTNGERIRYTSGLPWWRRRWASTDTQPSRAYTKRGLTRMLKRRRASR